MMIDEARKAKEAAEKQIEEILANLESETGLKVGACRVNECSDKRGTFRAVSLIINL